MARLLLAATMIAALHTPPTMARDRFGAPRAEQADPPEGYQPRLSAEAGVLCVKQCPNDSLPCDPPSYKIADGRCTTQWR